MPLIANRSAFAAVGPTSRSIEPPGAWVTLPWIESVPVVVPQKSNLVQKKRVAKALLEGLEGLDLLDVHHLLVEYGKKDLKKKPEAGAKA